MDETRAFLQSLGLPPGDLYTLPTSSKRFPDGAQLRIEMPSTEGPAALAAVIAEAKKRKVPVHRVSQGSGVMLHTDDEIREMAKMGADAKIEVCLFVGPRAAWEVSAQSRSPAAGNLAARHRGMDQLVFAIEDVKRACKLGMRSILIADEGLLWIVNEMKKAGQLPKDLVIKASVQIGAANPASVRMLEQAGASTYNIPVDLDLPKMAALRATVNMPLDIYIEVPDDFGGFIRHYEIPEIIRVVSPIYLKFGLRNAPNIYPSGTHLEATAVALSKERVRRAQIALEIVRRYSPDAVISKVGAGGVGVPKA
jgi:hypothetical protein